MDLQCLLSRQCSSKSAMQKTYLAVTTWVQHLVHQWRKFCKCFSNSPRTGFVIFQIDVLTPQSFFNTPFSRCSQAHCWPSLRWLATISDWVGKSLAVSCIVDSFPLAAICQHIILKIPFRLSMLCMRSLRCPLTLRTTGEWNCILAEGWNYAQVEL